MKSIRKWKKQIGVVFFIFVLLFICYSIGQKVVRPNRMKSEGYTNYKGEVVEYSILENFSSFSLGGLEMADVPGGKTISKIEFTKDNCNMSEEWLGNCILMLPNTSFAKRMKLSKKCTKIDFEYAIYPDISADVSDGAKISVEVYLDETRDPVVRQEISAKPENGLERACIDISEYAGKEVTIAFNCKDGGNGNEDGDWLMIKYPVIE